MESKNNTMTARELQSKAGKARAQKLSPERRIEIAKNAARVREEKRYAHLPKATHSGTITIGEFKIPCAVLENGTRVISETGIANIFGKSGGAEKAKSIQKKDGTPQTPIFLAQKNLNPFIPKDLEEPLFSPIKYHKGGKPFSGYPAELLPKICDVYLKAREEGALLASQASRAFKAELLIRGLAHVGIISLVDEASGYDEIRDKKALEKILDKFLNKEFAQWAKRFPDEFYKQIFRLRGWEWKGMKIQKPSCVGLFTEDLVYKRLGHGVLEELKTVNPKNENGTRKVRHHQFLTNDFGHPALSEHIHGLILLMKLSKTWDDLMEKVNDVLPKKTQFFELN